MHHGIPCKFAKVFPFAPLELFKNTGKIPKISVPVLSEGPLCFLLSTVLAALGFSHFWPVPLEVL